MSDQPAPEVATDTSSAGSKPGVSLTSKILWTVLAIAAVAAIYEFTYARPRYVKSADLSEELVTRHNEGDIDSLISPDDVRQEMGSAPSAASQHEHYMQEEYSWASGVPFKRYRVFFIYQRFRGDQWVLHSSSIESPPEAHLLPGGTVTTPPGGELAAGEAEDPLTAGGGGGEAPGPAPGGEGGAEGGGEGGARRQFDPAQVFAQRDADGDGKLTGDELSSRMVENLPEIDTDGDGSVSLEEFEARMRARGPRGGAAAGGAAGEGGRPARGRRGEPEAPGGEQPTGEEAPAAESPAPEVPASETPAPETPSSEAPAPEAPTSEAPEDGGAASEGDGSTS